MEIYVEWTLCLYVCVWKLLFLNGLLFLNDKWYAQPNGSWTHDIIFRLEFIYGGGASWDWVYGCIMFLATSDLRLYREWQGFSELWKVSSTGIVVMILCFTIPSLLCMRDICRNELNKITDKWHTRCPPYFGFFVYAIFSLSIYLCPLNSIRWNGPVYIFFTPNSLNFCS